MLRRKPQGHRSLDRLTTSVAELSDTLNFWHFLPGGAVPGPALEGAYDAWLVALSFSLAILGSLAALSVLGRLRLLSKPTARFAWLSAGSVAMGSGIWAMHFTGMLAFSMPTPMTFLLVPTVASFVPAVLGSYVALYTLSRQRTDSRSMLLAAAAFAAAIATMHFVGMEAMIADGAMMFYEPRFFALSVVVAYLLALTALYVRIVLEESVKSARTVPAFWVQPIAATVMGTAVAGMHYTAMAAAQFVADVHSHAPADALLVAPTSMSLAVGAVGAIIAVLTIAGVAVDRRLGDASQAVIESKLRHRAVVEHIRDGLIVVADDGRIQSVNPAAARIFGYPVDELVGTPLNRILPCDAGALASYVDALADASGIQRDGSPIALQITGHELRVGRTLATTLIVRCRDELETLERRLRRLAAAVEYTEEAIVILDADLRIVYVNPGFERKFTAAARGAIGKDASVALGIAIESTTYQGIKDALARSTVWQGRVVASRRDGRDRQIDVSISPVRNEINLVTSFVLFLRDMTEKLSVERQLHQAQRLESIGQLAAGIAHEMNTPAQFVADNIHFLSDNFAGLLKVLRSYRELLDPGAGNKSWQQRRMIMEELGSAVDLDFVCKEIPRALAEAEEGIGRVASIVRAMKEFSHPGSGNLEPADLNAAIKSTITVCRNRWKYVADLELDLADDLPLVPCQVSELNQVFLNLIVNAADALAESPPASEKGRIVVATRVVDGQVEVSVRDNGPGIPETLAARIFEPFFTTKTVGKGTGQGLAIARDTVVIKHRGTLTFDSLPGVATTFRIRLPLLQADAAALRA
jgi:PAS domain S-box-containing protein